MSKVIEIIEEKMMPIAGMIAQQRHLQAIRDGITLSMPMVIVGSLFLVIGFLPIPGYPEFMEKIFGELWRTKLLYPVGVSMDLMSLFISVGVAYRLAEKYRVDALSAGAISLLSFMLATPFKISHTLDGVTHSVSGIPLGLMGSKGMFVAILIAIFTTEIYRILIQKDIVIKMPEGVPPAVAKSFAALIPTLVVMLTIWGIRLGIEMTSFESIHTLVTALLAAPLTKVGASLAGALISVFLVGLFWGFGIHGMAIVGSVMYPIWFTLRDQNRIAFQAGEALPHIFTYEFFMIFVFLGGSGATLVFATLMVWKARSSQLKEVGKLSFGSGIFNINEPIVFGTPVIMNPVIMIPFIFTPVILTLVTWSAMKIGLVATPVGVAVPWTLPIGISGYLATGGKVSGIVMQFVNFAIGMAIYYPFFRAWDNKRLEEEKQINELEKAQEELVTN